jgi:hypothetical protein
VSSPAAKITGQYRANLAEFIERMARASISDPRIADRLGITVAQVRDIRKEYEIPAGERRWLSEGAVVAGE